MYKFLCIKENKDFEKDDMVLLLDEARKHGELVFTLPYPYERYLRMLIASVTELIQLIINNNIRHETLSDEQILQLKGTDAEMCRINEDLIYYIENAEMLKSFINVDCLHFLTFLIKNDKITHIFLYREINQI